MNENAFVRFGDSVKRGTAALAAVIARLTFWQFVLLCLLLMICGGIMSDTFFTETVVTPRTNHHKTVTKVFKKGADKEPVEIRIDEKGLVIRRNPQNPVMPEGASRPEAASAPEGMSPPMAVPAPPVPPNPDTSDDDDDDESDGGFVKKHVKTVPIMEIVMLLILFMIILRLLTNAKLKAEARASVAEAAADKETLERQLAEARLQAMQAQVEPHFLFNTLAAVEHLIETDPPRAAVMQRNLIGYLRCVLPNLRRADSTLGREITICRHYLEILKMRMENRLEFTIEIPPGLESAQMPPLMLPSLVENAIQHGIEPKSEGGRITLAAEIVDGKLAVRVDDTGVGFGAVPAKVRPGHAGGVGLSNIRERLAALFGKDGRLSISANEPAGTSVRLEIPYAVTKPADSADC